MTVACDEELDEEDDDNEEEEEEDDDDEELPEERAEKEGASWSTRISIGVPFTAMRASSAVFDAAVMFVAEKSIVWRCSEGRMRIISFNSRSKPSSRIRSASSITSTCRFLTTKPGVLWMGGLKERK